MFDVCVSTLICRYFWVWTPIIPQLGNIDNKKKVRKVKARKKVFHQFKSKSSLDFTIEVIVLFANGIKTTDRITVQAANCFIILMRVLEGKSTALTGPIDN